MFKPIISVTVVAVFEGLRRPIRESAPALIGTSLTQSTVSMKMALRKHLQRKHLRRADQNKRRGQDSNLRAP